MDNLLIHPNTRLRLNSVSDSPPHALLITGKSGSNKQEIARIITAKVLGIDPDNLDKYPYILTINNDEGNIPIESIRSINQFLKLKVPSTEKIPDKICRAIIINGAESMRTEAQNALLKTLEEPPEDTIIILTSESADMLLQTITSRVQEVNILPVSKKMAEDFYPDKTKSFDANFALSQGQTGLLDALINNESHPLLESILIAKQVIAEKKGDRLVRVEEIAKDKQKTRQLLDALLRITHAALTASSKKDDLNSVKKWQNSQDLVVDSIKKLENNAQTKLVLDNLFINF